MPQCLPGIDQLVLSPYKNMAGWEGGSRYPVHEDFSIKLAASIAALNNKQGVFSESFALIKNAKLKNTLQAAKRATGA